MTTYNCPHCRNPIYEDEALLCHFCGGSLGRGSRGMLGSMKQRPGKWLLMVLAVIVIMAFLMTIFR